MKFTTFATIFSFVTLSFSVPIESSEAASIESSARVPNTVISTSVGLKYRDVNVNASVRTGFSIGSKLGTIPVHADADGTRVTRRDVKAVEVVLGSIETKIKDLTYKLCMTSLSTLSATFSDSTYCTL
jgi:hypothetical protein